MRCSNQERKHTQIFADFQHEGVLNRDRKICGVPTPSIQQLVTSTHTGGISTPTPLLGRAKTRISIAHLIASPTKLYKYFGETAPEQQPPHVSLATSFLPSDPTDHLTRTATWQLEINDSIHQITQQHSINICKMKTFQHVATSYYSPLFGLLYSISA